MSNDRKWDLRFLDMAKVVAGWSKDPSTKTGAVIVDPWNRIISTGYNGFPQRIKDDDRLNVREVKYEMIVHCEVNALIFARGDIQGCALYTWPFMCCSRCAAIMIQAGIRRHVAPLNPDPRWEKSFELSTQLFSEANVGLVLL